MKSNRQPSTYDKPLVDPGLPVRHLLNLAILAILSPLTVYANPDGAQIINGQVNIDTSQPGVANITNSPDAIIQWQNFNIAQNEITRFIQQNSQSAVLNRIMGENPSQILGQLVSNGKVLLINPNGIVFGADSVVDTQGLVASSLNLSDDDFLKGNYHFLAGSKAGNIVNEGIIRAGKDGNILLIAPSITNNGTIRSEGGQITLAAGQELILTNLDNPDIRFAIQAPADKVLNIGKLLTEGGAVNVFANTIKHEGEINADSVQVDAQGHIKLVAQQEINLAAQSKISANNSQGNAGTIVVESKTGVVALQGAIEANATGGAGKGGSIEVLGEQVGVLDNAQITADGQQGGGQVLVGGDQQGQNAAVHNAKATYVGADTHLSADAKIQGDGGRVVVWSDKSTRAYGHISAKGGGQGGDGGFVETSGHSLDVSGIQVDASAAKGNGGHWLLDANNVTIQASAGTPVSTTGTDGGLVTAGSIQAALNNGMTVTVTTGMAEQGTQEGNIIVNAGISKTAGGDATFNLISRNNIDINAPVIARAGKLDLTLAPNSDAVGGGVSTIGSLVDLNKGKLTLNGESNVLFSGTIRNAILTIPELGNSELNGLLSNVAEVNIGQGAALTINRSASAINTVFNNYGMLDINDFFIMNTLNLYSGSLAGSGNVTVTQAFNFHPGTSLLGDGVLTTALGATTELSGTGAVSVDKPWNNLGTINWTGDVGIGHTTGNAAFNNFATGVININSAGVRELNTAVFNNRGVINLSDGVLKLLSPGADTGSYIATGSGLLKFWPIGSRKFLGGANVHSANPVSFANGSNSFMGGSSYYAPQTEVASFGALNFNTGKLVTLSELTVDSGQLGGVDEIIISDKFAMNSGSLTGFGKLTTAAGSITNLADTGLVNLNKRWDNLGTVNWKNADFASNGTASIFTNASGGIINIGNASTAADKEFSINTARFNNQGSINLAGGILKIFSPGSDTGSYQVNGNGQLQFWYGLRVFDHAEINSPNTVTFSNGKNYFRDGAAYSAGQTDLLNEALLNFSTHTAITLPKLTIDGGQLVGSDTVAITDVFNFHAGTVIGGTLTTAAQSVTTLADKDSVYLGKNWDNFGAVSWNGAANIRNPSNATPTFNNRLGGVFNIHNADPTATMALGLAHFNNAGTLNLSGGLLKISGPGRDTGAYQVGDAGELQFWDGNRYFDANASINSPNKVTFAGDGKYTFSAGSNFSVPEIGIDGARVIFNTGNTLDIPILTINNAATLVSFDAVNISKSFGFSSGLFTGNGKLITSPDAITRLEDGRVLLDKNWDNYGTVQFGVGVETITHSRTAALPIRYWDNYGTVNWQGDVAPPNSLASSVILTNKVGGVYNIDGTDPSGIRQLNLGAFNNDGTVNLLGGILQILSPGTDTGRYVVTGTGQLEFNDSTRHFNGSSIISANNPVIFSGSTSYFTNNAILETPKAVIAGAIFNVITPLTLNQLEMTSNPGSDAIGTLYNAGGLTATGRFDWSDGTLSGAGAYHFANGFAYTGGAMRATGIVSIVDNSGSLSLPSMPSVSQLSAYSSGQLTLTGDILASGRGSAITLEATKFINQFDSVLSARNGRWLIYSNTPTENKLGGLASDFKHYGCNSTSCGDGFDVAASKGNGLLYGIVPVLSVTPDKLTSVYGEKGNLTASYSGFIDGDDASSAGITGSASYDVSGSKSGAGFYHAGNHEVSYVTGLASQLGYRFQDNPLSTQEWAVTPRALAIAADAAGKTYGDLDPLFNYHATGLLRGDSVTGALARAVGEDVGDYAITQGSLTASSDYDLNYTANYLGISARALSVIADAQSKFLGELDPVLTYKSVGLVNGDTLGGFLSRVSGETVGRYAITQGSVAASPNYKLTYVGADLSIKPAPIGITQEVIRQNENVGQNQVLVLTQQAAFNGLLDNVTANNTPSETTVTDKAKNDGQKSLKQCQ